MTDSIRPTTINGSVDYSTGWIDLGPLPWAIILLTQHSNHRQSWQLHHEVGFRPQRVGRDTVFNRTFGISRPLWSIVDQHKVEIMWRAIGRLCSDKRMPGALGLSRWHITVYVVLPQAFRIIVPPLGNTMISMLKDSSLVSIVAVDEMMRLTQVAAAETYRPLELYAAAAVYYYLMTLVTARAINLIERRLSRLPDTTTKA